MYKLVQRKLFNSWKLMKVINSRQNCKSKTKWLNKNYCAITANSSRSKWVKKSTFTSMTISHIGLSRNSGHSLSSLSIVHTTLIKKSIFASVKLCRLSFLCLNWMGNLHCLSKKDSMLLRIITSRNIYRRVNWSFRSSSSTNNIDFLICYF